MRPISAAMRYVYERLELCSSVYQAMDDAHRYGDITRIERDTIDKIVARWTSTLDDSTIMNATKKRLSFKKLIQRQEETERSHIP